jgi:hypothetical protein
LNRRSRAGQARNEDTGEMSVKEISYRSAVCAEETYAVQQPFDGVFELLLAIYVIEEQFGLTLIGPEYRFFKLTYGVSDRGLELLAYQNVSCSEFRTSGSVRIWQ